MADLVAEYLKRCRWTISFVEVDHSSKQAESQKILSYVAHDDYVILLDERGQSMTSPDFSRFIEEKQSLGLSSITFIIGGAEGPDLSIHQRADKKMAFGIQTWPHMFVRLMLVEQLYRAEQILSGHPYHKN